MKKKRSLTTKKASVTSSVIGDGSMTARQLSGMEVAFSGFNLADTLLPEYSSARRDVLGYTFVSPQVRYPETNMGGYRLPVASYSYTHMLDVMREFYDEDRDVCFQWLVDIGYRGDEIRESRIKEDLYLHLHRDAKEWHLEEEIQETETQQTVRLMSEGYWS